MKFLLTKQFGIQDTLPLALAGCLVAFAPCAYQGASNIVLAARAEKVAVDTAFPKSRSVEDLGSLKPQPLARLASASRKNSHDQGVYRCILSESFTPLPAASFGFHPRTLYDGAPGDTRTGFASRAWQSDPVSAMCLIDLGEAPPRCARIDVRFATGGGSTVHQLHASHDGVNWRGVATLEDGTTLLPPSLSAYRYLQVVVGVKQTQRTRFKGVNVTDVRVYDRNQAVIGGMRRRAAMPNAMPDDTYNFVESIPFS